MPSKFTTNNHKKVNLLVLEYGIISNKTISGLTNVSRSKFYEHAFCLSNSFWQKSLISCVSCKVPMD